MSEYNCPACGEGLKEVRYNSDSMLNKYQFEAVRAGDYYCDACEGNRGNTGFRYFWLSELEKKLD